MTGPNEPCRTWEHHIAGLGARGRSLGARGILALFLAILWAAPLHGQVRQHGPSDFESAQSLGLEQRLVIDAYEEDLVPIRWLAASPEGLVYIAQEQDARILVFDSIGERRGSIGRRGEGPGEVQALMVAGFVGDTLWFYDGPQRRLNLVSPGLEVSRVARWPPSESGVTQLDTATETITFSLVFFQALLADRTVAAALLRPSSLPAGAPESAIFYGVVGADGEVRDLLGHVPPGPPPVRGDDGWLTYGTVPPEVEGYFAVSPGGERSALLVATMLGREAGEFEAVVGGVRGEDLLSVAGRAPAPIHGLVVGWDHSLWFRTEGESEARYYVLDSEGELKGRVDLPLNVEIEVVDAENVWAVQTDEFDVENVIRYARTERPDET